MLQRSGNQAETNLNEGLPGAVRRRALATSMLSACALATLMLAGCTGTPKVGPAAVEDLRPDGTIEMQQIQVAYIGAAGGGDGTLRYRGRAYPFTIAGVGIGGIGASTISAEGEVYKLNSVANFPGTYGQARYGIALGNRSAGDLWMQNDAGVILHLKAKRTGLMLSLGADAIRITMSK